MNLEKESTLELGRQSEYETIYNPNKLYAIQRKIQRQEIGVNNPLPFVGYDIWNHYEVSWLNNKGKPHVAIAEIIYPCDSKNIIESKSMKLYFNSLNNTRFESADFLQGMIQKDISTKVGANALVSIKNLDQYINPFKPFIGEKIDEIDIEITEYDVNDVYLMVEEECVQETLYSDLLKSNCLVTQQPDWGSLKISYKGKKINREGLLRYIISFRNHNEFHEQCIERIFIDIKKRCAPEQLIVYGRYTRRGGIDINPIRSSHPLAVENIRAVRQ